MGYPTDTTIWPTCLSSDARKLIDHFFTLADTRSDDAGPRIAQEIFAPGGEFISPQATFVGSAGRFHLSGPYSLGEGLNS
jgi:hypothetical protein